MLKVFINDSDQSDYLADSLTIVDQIQNKANTCNFSLNKGATAPSENQSVEIFDCVEIVSASSTTVEVKDILRSGLSILTFGKYRAGQYLWLGVGDASEERVIVDTVEASSTDGQVTITLVEAIANAHSAGEFAGRKVFGGTLTYVLKKNPHLLADVEYQCAATDFTKIFDKKLINDSWTDYDARQIINDALDTTINYNKELDDMDYADNTAVQAEWIESGDGNNPTIDTSDFIQGANSVLLGWTNSGGSATFSATPSSADFSDLTGASSGAPTKGNVTFWYKRTSAAGISTVTVRVGSDSSNYTAVSFEPEATTDWEFISLPLVAGTETGTPVWTAVDYLAVIVAETTTSSVLIDDIRVTADKSFTMYNFEDTNSFDDVRSSFKKPTVFIDALSDSLGFYWYIDYDRDIHFFDRETNEAPFDIDDTSDNFWNLQVDVDTAQLKNRQVVRGGTKTSDSLYTQVVQGDEAIREWIMKSQFKNLTIELDDNTTTDTMEAGTTTTTVNATAHGLADGDWIVNRTRSAARQITYVTDNQFTVLEVTGQTDGDSFSLFATTQTVGIEFLDDEASFDYMYNFNEKSIRSSTDKETLTSTEYLLFSYNEIIPIRVSVSDMASIASMKSLVGGDGIFDGAVITDESLDSTQAARDRAQAEVDQFGNPIVEVRFDTDYEGLESGQIINITDTNKSVADDFIIQRVKTKYQGDFPTMNIDCASTLFGIIEYFQKLSQQVSERLIDEDEVIDQIISESVEITVSESNSTGASEEVTESATITVTETDNTVTERSMTTDPYVWQPDASDSRWNLAQWG